jgi:XTP/dITP diphosphohydrolase
MRFMLASGNRHKLQEFEAILRPHRVTAMPRGVELPPEGLEAFDVNALTKAMALAQAVVHDERQRSFLEGMTTGGRDWRDEVLFIADDSGLEVEALGWAPGVTSARYAGVDGPGADQANVARLLRELAGVSGPLARRARFVCAVVAVTPRMAHYPATGYWWGAIDVAPRGEGGFGYDPVFIPQGSDRTVAQWPQELKDQASHRALAGKALLERLRQEGIIEDTGST